MKTHKWLGNLFQSSSVKTEEWQAFVRDFRSDMKSMLKDTGWILHDLSNGHFYVSGFLKNTRDGSFVYFSTSDVRFWQDEWHNNLLIRTAKHDKDYTGGYNQYTTFPNLPYSLERFGLK